MISHAGVEPTRRSGLKASPERRRANNKMARWGLNKIVRKKIEKNQKSEVSSPVFQSPKRQSDYRLGAPDRASSGGSILIGAAIIAAAILRATLRTAVRPPLRRRVGARDRQTSAGDQLRPRGLHSTD